MITQDGHNDLKTYLQATWTYIELRSDTNAPVIRISSTDPRASWTHASGDGFIELSVTLTGMDLTLPVTIASTALFRVATGGSALSEAAISPFLFQTTGDRLVVRHRIEVPKIG